MEKPFALKLHDPKLFIPPFSEEEMEKAVGCLKTAQVGQPEYADSLGWHKVSEWAGEDWLNRCQTLADKIKQDADAFVVIGIGGSNQAARAVIDALGERPGCPEIIWAGNSISAHSIRQVLKQLQGKKSVYINIIAKNFETLEPGIAFRVLRNYLRDAYGEGWEKRVVATGTEGSRLEGISKKHGFYFLPFPKSIAGRFTALSPIGLFPMAVAGLDIRALAAGAEQTERLLKSDTSRKNPALFYAMSRNALYKKGYRMEMLSFFEPRWFRFSKWWVQLVGESEGKDGKGIYPITGNFSEDLHSVGQFIQDGTHCVFEFFIDVQTQDASCVIERDEVDDGFDYVNGMDFHAINKAAFEGTVEAHSQVLPCFTLTISAIDEYVFGQLFYFFEFSCYLSVIMLGLNPFNQNGVEAYKTRMFKKLGK